MAIWVAIRGFLSVLIISLALLAAYLSITKFGALRVETLLIFAFALLLIFPMWLGELGRNPKTRKIATRVLFGMGALAFGWMALQSITASHPQVCGAGNRAAAGCALENAIFSVAGTSGVITFYAGFSALFFLGLVWPTRLAKQA